MIKDSGNRTQFLTGAARDIQEGKGRCDLMPLEVIADITRNDVIRAIGRFQETYDTEILEEMLRNKFPDNTMADTLLRLAVHYEEGAKKYGENNWKMGIPVNSYINSAVRHYLKWCRGDEDEPHDVAFLWNIVSAIWTVNHKEAKE